MTILKHVCKATTLVQTSVALPLKSTFAKILARFYIKLMNNSFSVMIKVLFLINRQKIILEKRKKQTWVIFQSSDILKIP